MDCQSKVKQSVKRQPLDNKLNNLSICKIACMIHLQSIIQLINNNQPHIDPSLNTCRDGIQPRPCLFSSTPTMWINGTMPRPSQYIADSSYCTPYLCRQSTNHNSPLLCQLEAGNTKLTYEREFYTILSFGEFEQHKTVQSIT